jgi:hypothetical protein
MKYCYIYRVEKRKLKTRPLIDFLISDTTKVGYDFIHQHFVTKARKSREKSSEFLTQLFRE